MTTFRQLALRVIVESGLNRESNDDVLSESYVFHWVKGYYQKAIDSMPRGTANRQLSVPLTTEASKQDGSVSVARGLDQVNGVGTAFSSSDVGRLFRISFDNVWYRIIGIDGQTLTLDSPFVGATGAGLAYFIATPLYSIPAIRWVTTLVLAPWGDLEELHPEKLTELHPYRALAPGIPRRWVKQGIDQTDGTRLIELFPYAKEMHRCEVSGYATLDEPTLNNSPMKEIDDEALVVGAKATAYDYRAQLAIGRKDNDGAVAFMRLSEARRAEFNGWLRQLSNRDSSDTAQPLVRVRIKHHTLPGYFDPITTAYDHVWNKP